MALGAERLERALRKVTVKPPLVPVISNVTGEPTQDPARIRANLVAQVTHPVRFVACVEAARRLGVSTVVEVGPGRVLSGLVRRIDAELETVGVDGAEALRALAAPMAGGGA
jgi:[acyl-carrier-protein] S-malonyltransferase